MANSTNSYQAIKSNEIALAQQRKRSKQKRKPREQSR